MKRVCPHANQAVTSLAVQSMPLSAVSIPGHLNGLDIQANLRSQTVAILFHTMVLHPMEMINATWHAKEIARKTVEEVIESISITLQIRLLHHHLHPLQLQQRHRHRHPQAQAQAQFRVRHP
jgi:hypothetical protein